MRAAFIEALSSFTARFDDIGAAEARLIPLREELIQGLRKTTSTSRLADDNELGKLAREVGRNITTIIEEVVGRWDAAAPMRELSSTFGDQVIILVFGKVNCGKSSFGNFVARQFTQEKVQYFYLENGKLIDTEEEFAEGATETTARIQGVRLGQRLVLLDSPGLHSVTSENGDLTRRFTDSADVVLWVTSSVAPGQVQELDDLKDEIERGKPLLPVITKSDVNVEDEVDGAIISVLELKSETRRAGQEADVHARASAKLGAHATSLMSPVSISVRYCRRNPERDGRFADSGMDLLFAQLANRVADAQTYKATKATRQVINYLENQVLGTIHDQLQPRIADLSRQASEQVKALDHQRKTVARQVMADVLASLPMLIEKTKGQQDVVTLRHAISNVLVESINKRLQETLSQYLKNIDQILVDLSSADIGSFTENSYDIRVVSGSGSRAAAAGAGAMLGAAVGTLVPIPVIGTFVGGLVGGWLGSKVGDRFVEERWETKVVGVTSEEILERVQSLLETIVPKEVNRVIDNCIESIDRLRGHAAELNEHITTFEERLKKAKDALHE
ncbi:MAG: GTP-binding protein HSR1-related protein [Moraxellaceae bacterium]|nr:GTP-binding protein HSR1-related protein [Moraxellaceae bacterium]